MTEDVFVCFKQQYTLSPKIPLTELPTDFPNVDSISIEFMTEKNYLTGFVLILKKELEETNGKNEIDKFSKFFTLLLCIKSDRHIQINPSNLEYIRKDGTTRIGSHWAILYNIEGSAVKLNIQEELLKISKSSKPHIKQYISYLAKSIIFYQEKFPDHSIIESFKVIEYDKKFSNYNMYYALRNILAHSPRYNEPYYKDSTISYFKESFNKEDFDYIKYEPTLIVLDLDSAKTQKKLNKIAIGFIDHLKLYLNIDK
jgi:hypothetical protein